MAFGPSCKCAVLVLVAAMQGALAGISQEEQFPAPAPITETTCSCQCCKGNSCSLVFEGTCDKSQLIVSCKDLPDYNTSVLQNVTLDPKRSLCFSANVAVCASYPECTRTRSDTMNTTMALYASGRTYFYDPVLQQDVNITNIEVNATFVMSPFPAPASPKVVIEANLETYCPCAAQWEADFQQFVMPALGDIVELRRYWDGTAKADGSVSCFHGDTECQVNTYEECARVQASSWQQSLAYSNCWNNCTQEGFPKQTCAGQYSFPKDTSLAQSCAEKHGLSWTSIASCAIDPAVGGKLLWNSSKFSDTHGLTPYGVKGLPVVFVDGKMESKFWDCNSHGPGHINLINAICKAYNGTKPAACSQTFIV